MAAAEGRHARQRPCIHNRAASGGEHPPPGVLAEGEAADDEVLEHLPQLLHRKLAGVGEDSLAGDVGEKVDPAELAIEPRKQLLGGLRARDIMLAGEGRAPAGGDRFASPQHAGGVAIEHYDGRAVGSQRQRTGPPHATGRARHHRHFAFEIKQAVSHESCAPSSSAPAALAIRASATRSAPWRRPTA